MDRLHENRIYTVCNLPYTLQGRPYHRAAEGGGPYGCTERIYPRAPLRPSR